MYTIDFRLSKKPDFIQLTIPNIKFLKFFDEGPLKIRVFLKKNIAHIVPIVFPSMEINENMVFALNRDRNEFIEKL